jgi:hypothetical protein
MNPNRQTEVVTRDSVLRLLSEKELAHVSTAESGPSLPDGEEYLDLGHLERGVRRALEKVPPTALVLLRRSVHEKRWNLILAHLARHMPKAS